MIFKRAVAKLRAQDWVAIAIEFAIVVAGVFVGTQVSNWNAARLERNETLRTLSELRPQLTALREGLEGYVHFNTTARQYAPVAFAGWRGDPKVSDRDFVIAAYLASRIGYTSINNASWSQFFGGDRLKDLKDKRLKTDLANLMTGDYSTMEKELFSPYRTHVRMIVPEDIQDAIRRDCPDVIRGELKFPVLAKSCTLNLPEDYFSSTARQLRTHPELVGELRWHLAASFNYIEALNSLGALIDSVLARIDKG